MKRINKQNVAAAVYDIGGQERKIDIAANAQVLGVRMNDTGGIVLQVMENPNEERVEQRSFYVLPESYWLPESVAEQRPLHVGTVQDASRVWHVFELDSPEDLVPSAVSAPRRSRPGAVTMNSIVGNVAPGAGIMQVGSLRGRVAEETIRRGGVHIQ